MRRKLALARPVSLMKLARRSHDDGYRAGGDEKIEQKELRCRPLIKTEQTILQAEVRGEERFV